MPVQLPVVDRAGQLTADPAAPSPLRLPPSVVTALYVHVPFCFHKCHYCDFYSITRQSPDRMRQYVDLLLREADMWTGPAALPRSSIATVFFGGGTPSLLPIDQMQRLIEGLIQRFDLTAVTEWTVEINPATASPEYCQMLRRIGVDRLSFGAQSSDLAELQTLERHHHPDDVRRSINIARDAGFSRLNVDLIYAIPGQNLASWHRSLDMALELKTEHVSCYNLTYEPNTPIAVLRRLGRLTPVDEATELEMFHAARQRLSSAGFEAYEISNYALPGQACQHNLAYWTGKNYIGLGPSAASHIEGHRWKNRPHLGEWETAVGGGHFPATDYEILNPARRAGELAMLMLRLAGGLKYADFADRTGLDARAVFADVIARYEPAGLLIAGPSSIELTEKGLNVSDSIAAEFLDPA